MEYYENLELPEQAVLVGVDTGDFDAEASLAELEELARTAGAEVAAQMLQKREKPDSATYIGAGKLEELKEFCQSNDVDLIVADGELSPSQQQH